MTQSKSFLVSANATLEVLTLALLAVVLASAACSPAAAPSEAGFAPQPARRATMAITIDDLPSFGQLAPLDTPEKANRRLLDAIDARGIRPTGFVNCAHVADSDPVLHSWVTLGLEIGNHTSHHLDLHKTQLSVWTNDVEDCHHRLVQLGVKPRYFRYPMLHQGTDEQQRKAATSALCRLGYSVAHVSIDNSEWLLAQAYGEAVANDNRTKANQIAAVYVQHMLSAVEHFDRVAEEAFGRRVPHVLLLHANALAADHIGKLLDTLAERGTSFVSLSSVLEDPAYSLPDIYYGPKGLSWFYRTTPSAIPRWSNWDEKEAARITAAFPPAAPR